MGNTLTTFHYDNIIQNYQQLQMLLENKKKARPERDGAGVSGCCLSDGRWWCITFWLCGLSNRRRGPCGSLTYGRRKAGRTHVCSRGRRGRR